MILILCKSIQANISSLHDVNLHCTALGLLSNLIPSISAMELIVSQKLMHLLDQNSKKFFKAIHSSKNDEFIPIYSDVCALILETFNSVITHSLMQNTNIVYALLQRHDLFVDLMEYERFDILASNIDKCICHFSEKIIDAKIEIPTVDSLLRIIEDGCLTFNHGVLQTVKPVVFGIQENEESYLFFLPLVWRHSIFC